MKWLAECSAAALHDALRAVAPDLSGYPVTVPGPAGKQDPQWHSGSVPVGERFFVKFAWSRPAALQLAHEIGVLAALARQPAVPFLPEVITASTDPLLLITRRVPGAPLFEVVGSIDPDRAARQLVRFLAALHHPAIRQRAEAAVGPLTGPVLPPATTQTLRDRFGTWIRPDQRRTVLRWCDWADAVLASPGPAVLVHGDLHGDNQVWDHDELRLVVDFATVGAAEPEYELRTYPGPGLGPGLELLTAVMQHYQQVTGRQLSADRVMAWHLRQALGDAMWHSEAGIPLNDHRTPPQWVDDLAARFSALGIDPEAPPAASPRPVT
jgi:aminoglycoside phosphotransferase (APT) family kinase protein